MTYLTRVRHIFDIYTTRVRRITVLLYTQALDKKQHNHDLKGDYLKLILHSRHVFLQYDYLFVRKML